MAKAETLALDPKVAAVRDEIKRREAQVAHCMAEYEGFSDLAHAAGMAHLADEDNDELKEASRTADLKMDAARKRLENVEGALRTARRKLEDLNDPRQIEKRAEQRARLTNLKERRMAEKKTSKSTAKDQGFPSVYLADNGNFKVGMDAAAKGDMVSALVGQKKKDARYDFTTPEGLKLAQKLIDARGWQGFVTKRQAKIEADKAKAEKAKADKAAAKKTPAKATATKAKTGTETTGDVTPDPKPAPRKRTGRKVGS